MKLTRNKEQNDELNIIAAGYQLGMRVDGRPYRKNCFGELKVKNGCVTLT